MPLYIFQLEHGWCKFGVSAGCPWVRYERHGFWGLQHPPCLCGKLGPDHVDLIYVFRGGLAEEAAIKASHPPDMSEFYLNRLDELLAACAQFERLPLPPRPPIINERKDMRGCCLELGNSKRQSHVLRSHVTKGKKEPCPLCGKVVAVRRDKLKAHQASSACRRA